MKNFLKENIRLFLGVIIGILASSITAYAVNSYTSNQIRYQNNMFAIDNVSDALDDLYSYSKDKIDSNTSNNYSTEEQVVGTWIDGKPLYQRCFEILNDLTVRVDDDKYYAVEGFTNNYKTLVAPIIDKLVYVDVLNNEPDGNIEANTIFRIKKDDGTIHSVDSPYFKWLGFKLSANSIIVIQYTKTTDTATN